MKKLNLFVLVFLSSVQLFAQTKYLNLKVSNKPLSFILLQIKEQASVEFYYSSNVVDVNQNTSINIQDASLNQVLNKLFYNTPITYTVNGNKVLLFKNPNYKVIISGYLREQGTGELLIGATVSTTPAYAGCVTNAYGFYSISLPTDTFSIQYSYVGYKGEEKKINSFQSQQIDVELVPNTSLTEAKVEAKNEHAEPTLNKVVVPLHEINNVPMVLGEKDVVKFIMLSPGVQKGSEGNAYMYVRGGGPDQNLILIDDAVIYNAYHFLGLASLFSGNELRKAELYKGGFSSKYGGRLSSVLDMSMKDGNRQKVGVDATFGLISSRILVEGPIQKEKSSFLFSYRKSYLNQSAKLITNDKDELLDYGYYDFHAKLSTNIGTRDRLMLSGYMGNDALANNTAQGLTSDEDGVNWGNRAASFRWNHQFNGRWFANTSLVSSYYLTRIAFGSVDENSQQKQLSAVQSSILDYTLKSDVDFLMNANHQFKYGAGLTWHHFNSLTTLNFGPGNEQADTNTYVSPEAFAYAEWQFNLNSKWSFTSGLRFSYFKQISTYTGIEPRLNIVYQPTKNWQLNGSYAYMNQYLHLISAFNGLGLPSDAWVSSSNKLAPQSSQLVTIGVLKNHFFSSKLAFTVELYGKSIKNTTALKEGASFFQVLPINGYVSASTWEDLATQGNSTSYGAEFMLKKTGQKLHGHISYTASRTTMQFDELNNGKSFLATFDRPHDVGLFIGYKLGKHFLFSANWVYGSGNLISMPTAKYYSDNTNGVESPTIKYYYEGKNNYRVQNYHRLDFSVQYLFKMTSKINSTIELSIYNIYSRANPFYYEINSEYDGSNGNVVSQNLQKVSLFPIMPSLSWGLKF